MVFRAEVAILAVTVMSFRRMVPLRAFAQVGAGEGADGAREVEGDGRQDQPGRVGGELSRGQVRQCTVFEVRVDLLNDGVGGGFCLR